MIDETTNLFSKEILKDLLFTKENVYDKCKLEFTQLNIEDESAEYGACNFRLNNLSIKFRVAKITPTKTGQFVTIWKRNKNGTIEPLDISDDLDFVVISTRSSDNFGQFIFPKSILFDNGILSHNNKAGKRGIRVYPPWDKAMNKQAEKTQKWQLIYFLEISTEHSTNLDRAIKLFNENTLDK